MKHSPSMLCQGFQTVKSEYMMTRRDPLWWQEDKCCRSAGKGISFAHMQCKVDAIEAYGGIITPCAPTMESREAVCAEVMARTGTTFIPPYNYGPTICGQGTIALEFLKQASTLFVRALNMCFRHLRGRLRHMLRIPMPSVCAWYLKFMSRCQI